MRYASLGQVPRKRHSQVRDDGRLLVEEVMGYEGFSGNESILYHVHSPCRIAEVGSLRPLERAEWLLEHAPFSQRDFRPPVELETRDEARPLRLTVRVRGGLQSYLLDRHPFDVVGWDGYVWPYAFNAGDFEPRAGRFHLPPPTHQTFQGPGFVICTFAPRLLDWDPQAVPLPYHHSNLHSEEVMYYADGDYAARKGVEVGCVTVHAAGLPHGPQPGTVEKALGAKSTSELAVMWDTFRPLRLTTLWQAHDKPEYALSWNPDKAPASGGANGASAESAAVTGP